MTDWDAHVAREVARYEDGKARLPAIADADDRQRQLTRMGNAAGGAGLALLMGGLARRGAGWFARAAERYRESFPEAPPGSWGRPIGAMKARLLAGDWPGAESDAEWALDDGLRGGGVADRPLRRVPGVARARPGRRGGRAGGVDPGPRRLPGRRRRRARRARRRRCRRPTTRPSAPCCASFETREEYLEDIPVADTVIVLQALAAPRGLAVRSSRRFCPSPRRSRARASASSPPGSRSGTQRARLPARARGWRGSSCRRAT